MAAAMMKLNLCCGARPKSGQSNLSTLPPPLEADLFVKAGKTSYKKMRAVLQRQEGVSVANPR